MTETKQEIETPILSEKETQRFLSAAIDSTSGVMARYSLAQTPLPDFNKGIDEEVAEFLAQVEVDDKVLSARVQGGLERNISEDALFEAASLTLAKAKLAAEEARGKNKSILERFGDKILDKASEAIAKVGGKRALAATSGIALMATACSARVTPAITPEVATPQAVATETIAAPTPTVEPTPTTEPSPTPEVVTGDPREISSWPERYQTYFAHPDPAAWEENGVEVTDEQFDTFLNSIRRNYLTDKGIEGVGEMTPEEVLWAMIEESAREQREIILSPEEIRRIATDPEASVPWNTYYSLADPSIGITYGLWKSAFIGLPDPNSEQYISVYNWVTSEGPKLYSNFPITYFGVEDMLVRAGPGAEESEGDYVGLVRLPADAGYGILIQLKDGDLNRHLYISQILFEPISLDENSLCINGGLGPCPSITLNTVATISSRAIHASAYQPITHEEMILRLSWPPQFIRIKTDTVGDFSRGGRLYSSFYHPVSGLNIMTKLVFFNPETFQNDQDIQSPVVPVPR